MIPWPILLAVALLASAGGSLAAPRAGRLLRRHGRAARLAWHLAVLGLWGLLAWRAGRPDGIAPDWDNSALALVLAAGMVWVEGWSLFTLTRERKGAASPAAEVEARVTAGVSTMAPEPQEDSPEAEALLRRIESLGRIPVDAIMTPREAIVYLDGNAGLREALDCMRLTGKSRVLVVAGGSLDRIWGVAHAKDLVPRLLDPPPGPMVRRHLRRWLRVLSGQPVSRLLEDFRRDRVHIAVVGDALGRTRGLVTLGDVFQYISGARNGSIPPERPPEGPR